MLLIKNKMKLFKILLFLTIIKIMIFLFKLIKPLEKFIFLKVYL